MEIENEDFSNDKDHRAFSPAKLDASSASDVLQSGESSSQVRASSPEKFKSSDDEISSMGLTDNYLPLAPEIGLKEAQHCRSASCKSDVSHQSSRFLSAIDLKGEIRSEEEARKIIQENIKRQIFEVEEPSHKSKTRGRTVHLGRLNPKREVENNATEQAERKDESW